ncbi:MAG: alpha/beta hydrolase domain-containing protein [Armatimonadota bacterium]
MKLRHLVALAALLAVPSAAEASLTRLEITGREPYAGGKELPRVGAYQRLTGRAHFELDPEHAANKSVVDLELASRNAAGKVELSADVEILTPADPDRANGTLLYDVNNRGGVTAGGAFNGGAPDFLMRYGYIVVSSGWIGELLPGGGRLRLDAPVATANGRPLRGWVRAELVPDRPAERLSIAHWAGHGSYPFFPPTLRAARLTWRQRESDPRVAIPIDQWHLEQKPVEADGVKGKLPLVELVLSGGFRPGYIYELIYQAEGPLVQGTGFAGMRDLISFLKHERGTKNPLRRSDGTPAAKRAIGFGISQSGRALRQFTYDGFNADEQGRIVFDGLMPHVAGAGLGFFNHRFASPTRHSGQHDHHLYPVDLFPFAYGDEKDPFSGRTDSILRKARAAKVVPKVFHVQTSAEYWHRSGSLVHTDPAGKRDSVIPPEVRIYSLGGAQHGPGSGLPSAEPHPLGQLPANHTDYRPVLRALLLALDGWIREGKTPPPSAYPRIADGTLVPWQGDRSGWRPLPGVRYPEVIQEPAWLDFGPEWAAKRIITEHPPQVKGSYTVLVPAVGDDNNERGMLLLPNVAVPTATYTGWNLRNPAAGADGELLSLTGAAIPFLKTREDRLRAGDPRPSLRERYPTFADYLEQYTAAARTLIQDRYVLEEDFDRLLELARSREALF